MDRQIPPQLLYITRCVSSGRFECHNIENFRFYVVVYKKLISHFLRKYNEYTVVLENCSLYDITRRNLHHFFGSITSFNTNDDLFRNFLQDATILGRYRNAL